MKLAASARALTLSTLVLLPFSLLCAQQAPDPHSVPVVDGAIGPCSAEFTINDTNGKPVYAAQITVRVNYGHFHKLDLEVGTNIDGKARFAGLPTKVKTGLFFQASEGSRTGNAFDDPSKTCTAQFTVVLRKPLQ
ncbi:MAG: hypothetical protein WCB05_21055 [Candidatus Sulfotelmatobacter sp.]